MALRIGILGAGVSGLTAARLLAEHGHSVVVLDKGRGVGGRASTRRSDFGSFDHGAPEFRVRDPAFRAFLETHLPPDRWACWEGRFARLHGGRLEVETDGTPRYVGVPGMNAIGRSLAEGLEIRTEAEVDAILGSPGCWHLRTAGALSFGPFDRLLITAPPPQAARLLERLSPIADPLRRVEMLPCFSLMLAPTSGMGFPADGIRCEDPVLGWAANEHSKPGRPPGVALVIHSSPDWAAAHRENDRNEVARALRRAAEERFGLDLEAGERFSLHRWLYAAPANPVGEPFLSDDPAGLAACGDWCLGGGVEGAFLSGAAVAVAWSGAAS